ncbi:unnamed protein product [Nyctereutes procyonoides]|uniref:(raccoon dog) hypothetical protein n=1 Tax=Nyctereutes procyonoides TaxID=34880 RepID=A0A811Y1P0_NYCPR|nr:unnamed protein product [Nyctereutes procyonoides]
MSSSLLSREPASPSHSGCHSTCLCSAACTPNIESGITKLLLWELHSASQHQAAIALNCVSEHLCSLSIYFVHLLAKCVLNFHQGSYYRWHSSLNKCSLISGEPGWLCWLKGEVGFLQGAQCRTRSRISGLGPEVASTYQLGLWPVLSLKTMIPGASGWLKVEVVVIFLIWTVGAVGKEVFIFEQHYLLLFF